MPTQVRDPQPAEFQALLERPASPRPAAHAAGLTVTGQFNLGDDEHDYRVPDGGLHRDFADRVFYRSAVLVIKILSPGDESREKLDFYAAHGIEELLIVDPQERTVSWLGLEGSEYQHLKRSRLVELGASDLAERIDWP